VGTVSVLLYFFCYLFLSSARDVCITPIVWLFFVPTYPEESVHDLFLFSSFFFGGEYDTPFSCIHGCGFCPVLSRFGWLLSLAFFLSGGHPLGERKVSVYDKDWERKDAGLFFSFDSVFDSGELAPFPPVF
jgi:hypothetical protein